MNRFFKNLSLSIVSLALFASTNTHCMHINKFKKFPTTKRQYTANKIQPVAPLGYREDPYLSNWLSFKTPEEAAQALTSEYGHTRESAQRFFMHRIERKQDFALIALLAEQNFTAPEKPLDLGHTKESALQIFIALAKKDYIHDTALQAAATGMLTARGWGHISWEAQNLFEILFQKKHPQAFEVAIQTATDTFLDQDWRTRHEGLQLFRILFNYGKGFKEATQIATDVINNESNWEETLQNTFQLLIDLVNKNQGYEPGYEVATNIAIRLYMSEYQDVQKNVLQLFIALVKKNRAIEQAMHVVEIKSDDTNMPDLINELKLLCLEKTKRKKIKCGPIKDFIPVTELRRSNVKPEPWSYDGKKEEISVDDFLYGLQELEKRHKAHSDQFDKE